MHIRLGINLRFAHFTHMHKRTFAVVDWAKDISNGVPAIRRGNIGYLSYLIRNAAGLLPTATSLSTTHKKEKQPI